MAKMLFNLSSAIHAVMPTIEDHRRSQEFMLGADNRGTVGAEIESRGG